MNNAAKGALLSGFVVPGLGQLVFKHYLRGGFFLLVVCSCLFSPNQTAPPIS